MNEKPINEKLNEKMEQGIAAFSSDVEEGNIPGGFATAFLELLNDHKDNLDIISYLNQMKALEFNKVYEFKNSNNFVNNFIGELNHSPDQISSTNTQSNEINDIEKNESTNDSGKITPRENTTKIDKKASNFVGAKNSVDANEVNRLLAEAQRAKQENENKDGLGNLIGSTVGLAANTATALVGGAASLVAGGARMGFNGAGKASNYFAEQTPSQVTEKNKKTMDNFHLNINNEIDAAQYQAGAIAKMSEGPERDSAVKEFANHVTRASNFIHKYGESGSAMANDKNNIGGNKETQEQIEEKVDSYTKKLQDSLDDVKISCEGDEKNQAVLKKAQESIKKMIEALVNAIKSFFGSKEAPALSTGPKP